MAADLAHLEVLAAYPDDCRASQIEPLGSAGGFSGARFWRVSAPCGVLCLRRWPPEHPSPEQLQFIQAVLWHVVQEGFRLVPLPLSTRLHKGYVRLHGHLWELTPWMPGKADYRAHPTHQKLRAAMVALAEFHLAAATFPLPHPPPTP
jgi:Ser/Thr protein kinase RdoA (MazF antagonist)